MYCSTIYHVYFVFLKYKSKISWSYLKSLSFSHNISVISAFYIFNIISLSIFPLLSYFTYFLWNLGKGWCNYIGSFFCYATHHWPQSKHHNTIFSRTLNKLLYFLWKRIYFITNEQQQHSKHIEKFARRKKKHKKQLKKQNQI